MVVAAFKSRPARRRPGRPVVVGENSATKVYTNTGALSSQRPGFSALVGAAALGKSFPRGLLDTQVKALDGL